MKKHFLLITALVLSLALLAGCTGTTVVVNECTCPSDSHQNPPTEPVPSEPTPSEPAEQGALKLGLAIVPNISGSKSATAEENGKADYDMTLVAVLVNEAGQIHACILDSVGTSVAFDTAGQAVDFDPAKQILTKNELGDAYGMKAYGGAKYEWYEQAAALANFAVGKTVQQLRSGAINEAGKAQDADLASVATIYLGGYVNAIEKAVANAQPVAALEGHTLKLATTSTVEVTAGETEGSSAQLNLDVVAMTMDEQVITACVFDSIQAKVSFDGQGAIVGELTAPQTKNELGEAYGMKAYAGAKYEWNEQAANFAAYVTGKTAEQVAGISINEATKPADGTDLAATVTISVIGFMSLIAKAAG